jgi:predicted ATPase
MPGDNPIVRIEVSGVRGAGKSVLIAHLHRWLNQIMVDFEGPAWLPARDASELSTAIANLKQRGFKIEIVETQTGIAAQVEARCGGNWPWAAPL